MTSRHQELWTQLGSGIHVPSGHMSSKATTGNTTYLDAKQKAVAIQKLYHDNNVSLPFTCDLALHVTSAISLSDSWLLGEHNQITAQQLYRAVHLEQLADSLECLRDGEKPAEILRKLTSGSIDAFDRVQSHAKDTIWELTLCSVIQRKGVDATLAEPDIVLTVQGEKIGVACKKVYSEANVERTLSNGVEQIERHHGCGILAINIDDIGPANSIRMVASVDALEASLAGANNSFLARHERHFKRYLSTGRVLGALVSSGGIVQVNMTPTNARQMTVWAMPGLTGLEERHLRFLEHALVK